VIVDLRSNFGYQGSITAGLHHASNDMIVTIDADLQDDPNKIEEMVEKHYEGFDLVLGVRENRESDSFFKRNSAEAFYKLMGFLGVNSVRNHGDFRLMSKGLLNDFKQHHERNRYIRGMILSLESKYAIVKYPRSAREAGETKFNFKRLIGLALDGITSFSIAPIRMIVFLGLIMFGLSLIGISYILYQKFFAGIAVEGWAFVALSVSLFGGLNSLFIGIIGEYVGKSYIESKQRPNFTVREFYTKKAN
jgi:glycosyltransferase involved in cell wall biosynthesis